MGRHGERVRRPARTRRDNGAGAAEEIRRYCLFGAQASGSADRFKGFAEECMAEYDSMAGRCPTDLTDPGELRYHAMRGAGTRG